MLLAEYRLAPEVEEVAKKIIEDHRPDIKDAKIAYMFRNKAQTKSGKIVMGSVKKVSALYHEITGLDYIVKIPYDVWSGLDEQTKEALIDHELRHCGKNEDGEFVYIEHDFEGFIGTLKMYGFWQPDLKLLQKNIIQMQLPFTDEGSVSIKNEEPEVISASV